MPILRHIFANLNRLHLSGKNSFENYFSSERIIWRVQQLLGHHDDYVMAN